MSRPADDTRAVILAAALTSISPAPSIIGAQLRVPGVYAIARNHRPPLDLDADVFRYCYVGGRLVAERLAPPTDTAERRRECTHIACACHSRRPLRNRRW